MIACAIFMILASAASREALAADSCQTQNLCYCETKTTFVDLNTIGSITFNTTDPQGANQYAVRLCQNFSLPYAACNAVHGCQYNTLSRSNFSIANSSNPIFSDSNTLIYRSANRTTIVKISCSASSDNFTFFGENPLLTYNFAFSGKAACPKDLPVSSTTTTTTASSTSTTARNTTTAHTTGNTTVPANTTVTTHPPTNTTASTPISSSTTTAKASNTTTLTTATKSSTPKTSSSTHIISTTTHHNGAATPIRSMIFWFIAFAVGLSSRRL